MVVYFAQAGGYIKIGYSADPIARSTSVTLTGRRPADLPRGAETVLVGWVPGDRDVEAAWHRRFALDHVTGEWFYLDTAMVRELIWADPRGIDVIRMSAMAVFAADRYHPEATRDELAELGYLIESVSVAEAMKEFGRPA